MSFKWDAIWNIFGSIPHPPPQSLAWCLGWAQCWGRVWRWPETVILWNILLWQWAGLPRSGDCHNLEHLYSLLPLPFSPAPAPADMMYWHCCCWRHKTDPTHAAAVLLCWGHNTSALKPLSKLEQKLVEQIRSRKCVSGPEIERPVVTHWTVTQLEMWL